MSLSASESVSSSKYFVLAFDGGGCRSVIQWTILKRIMAEFPKLLSLVDVFTGTSAGSIIASGIVAKLTEHSSYHFACDNNSSINNGNAVDGDCAWNYVKSELDNLFTKDTIGKIFEPNPKSCKALPISIASVFRAEYSHQNLYKLLHENFGDSKVADCKRTLFIPVYAINNDDLTTEVGDNDRTRNNVDNLRCDRWHISSFHNLGLASDSDNGEQNGSGNNNKSSNINIYQARKQNHDNILLSVAVQASCSAPTYFGLTENFCDGGIWANNPSLAVITEMCNRGVNINDIYVLNIGSGETPTELNWPKNSEPGLLKWAPHIVTMILDASQEASTWTMKHIFGKQRYYRVQPLLEQQVALDDVSKFDYLVQKGNDEDLTALFQWIRENVI